jgi:hypothetical protein
VAEFFENGKIQNEIADCNASARFPPFRLKDAEGKILDGEMRIRRNVDE